MVELARVSLFWLMVEWKTKQIVRVAPETLYLSGSITQTTQSRDN